MSRHRKRYGPNEWTEFAPWGYRTVARKRARRLYSRLRDATWGHQGITEIYILWPGDVLEFVTKLEMLDTMRRLSPSGEVELELAPPP